MRSRAKLPAFLASLVAVAAAVGVLSWAVVALAQRAREMVTAGLSAGLGREVEVGALSGDFLRGFTLEDVSLPEGTSTAPAFAARRVTVHIDFAELVVDLARRRNAIRALSSITVEGATVRVTRDASGDWNIMQLLPAGARGGEGGFQGRVIVVDSAIEFRDALRIAPAAFVARFTDVGATADFGKPREIALRASLIEERAGRRTPGRVSGRYDLAEGLLDLDIQASDADLGAWGPYLIPGSELRVTGGRADASLHLLRTRVGSRSILDVSGRVTGRGVSLAARRRGIRIAGATGVLDVNNRMFATPRLSGYLNGMPIRVAGEVSLHGEPWVDLALRSDAANITTIGRLVFPRFVARVDGSAQGDVRVVGPISNPRIHGRIASARGRLDGRPFEQASGDFSLSGGLLTVRGATATLAGAALAGNLRWSLVEPEYAFALRFAGADLREARRWLPVGFPVVDGTATGTLLASRASAGNALAGRAVVVEGQFRGEPFEHVDASFQSSPRGIVLDHVVVRAGAVRASATGTIDAGGRLSLHAVGRSDDLGTLPWSPLGNRLAGAGSFAGHIGGTTQSPLVDGTVQLFAPRVGTVAFDSASARIEARRDRVRVREARVRAKSDIYTASGTVGWGSTSTTQLDVRTDRASAAWLAAAAGLGTQAPIDGIVAGQVHVEGSLSMPRASGGLSLRDGRVLGQTVDRAAGSFRWDGRRLTVEGASASRRQSDVHFSGVVDRLTGYALDVTARNLDLGDLTLPQFGATRVEGHADVVGRVTGALSAPALTVSVDSRDFSVNRLRFDSAGGTVRLGSQALQFDPLTLRLAGERYEIGGEVRFGPTPQLALSATVEAGRLTTLLTLGGTRLGVPLDGTISGTATLEGAAGNPAARLDLKMEDGQLGQHTLQGHVDLTLKDRTVSIETFDIRSGDGRVVATGRYDLRGGSQIEIGGVDLALDLARPFLRLRRPLLGRMSFTLQFGGTAAAPELGLDLEITRGGIEGATFDSFIASGYYRDGVLRLQQGLLVQAGHKLRAAGSAPVNPRTLRLDESGSLDFRFALADVDLSLLRLVTDRVEAASGPVTGELRVGGTVAAPQSAGALRIENGAVRIRGLRTPIEALRLDLGFTDSTLRMTGAARAGGGTLGISGAARLALGGTPFISLVVAPEAPLVLNSEGVRLQLPPAVDARFDGTLRFHGALGDARRPPTLSGRVRVSDGTLAVGPGIAVPPVPAGTPVPARPSPPAGVQVPARTPAAPGASLAFQALQLDVGRDLAVAVGDLRFLLRPEGALTLGGTLRSPTLDGTVEAQNTTVTAIGNSFEIEEGSATFRAPLGLRPQINARAVTHVGSTRIMATISGTAPDALDVDLRSTPELTQEQITALLGRQAGVTQLLAGDLQGALRAELSRRLFAPVTLALGRAIGLAELTIEYDFERPLSLRLGKALFPDLYLSVTLTFAESTRLLWAVEYRFARDWELTLRVDEVGRRDLLVWYTVRF